jgi:hypothetical protein
MQYSCRSVPFTSLFLQAVMVQYTRSNSFDTLLQTDTVYLSANPNKVVLRESRYQHQHPLTPNTLPNRRRGAFGSDS